MKKPLELIVYPLWTSGLDGTVYCSAFQHQGYPRPVDIDVLAKRFTDAELAAEYQNSRLVSYVRHRRTHNYPTDMTLFDHYERGLEQEWILERFATLPHYDESEDQ